MTSYAASAAPSEDVIYVASSGGPSPLDEPDDMSADEPAHPSWAAFADDRSISRVAAKKSKSPEEELDEQRIQESIAATMAQQKAEADRALSERQRRHPTAEETAALGKLASEADMVDVVGGSGSGCSFRPGDAQPK